MKRLVIAAYVGVTLTGGVGVVSTVVAQSDIGQLLILEHAVKRAASIEDACALARASWDAVERAASPDIRDAIAARCELGRLGTTPVPGAGQRS